MFTGIVTAIGRIASARPHGDGLRLRIDAPGFGLADVALGDSIALQGVCHTVVAKDGTGFEVDTSAATLAVTTGLAEGREVNLEKSLTLADRLGGHLVSGHVDGVGEVVSALPDARAQRWRFHAPAALMRYIAAKGSIAVDGVSLTVNEVGHDTFGVALIPHTMAATTFRARGPGAAVNLEVDMVARYVERLQAARAADGVGDRG